MFSKISALALIGVLSASPLLAAEQTVNFSVPGMYCASCPYIVESAMGSVPGVVSVAADSATRTAQVVYDDEIANPEDFAEASAMAGYDAEVITGGS